MVRSDNDMVLFRPGSAGDAELGAFGLGGDNEAVVVVPVDAWVALGADVGTSCGLALTFIQWFPNGWDISYALPDEWSGACWPGHEYSPR